MPPKKGQKYKKTKDAEAIREYWRNRIAQDQEPLYIAMRDKAIGCEAVDHRKPGRFVYEIPPDPNAFKALIEHSLPKQVQPVSGEGENGEIIHKVIGVTMIVPKNGEGDKADA